MKLPNNNISVIINTFNEERNIRNCLESVKWADEIVIVDMYSTDRTIEIAREYTDKIYYFENVGYSEPARQFALEKVSKEWILVIDADEMAPKLLYEQLIAISSRDEADVVWIPRKNHFFGAPYLGNPFKDMQSRFFKKGFMRFSDVVHDFTVVSLAARVLRINNTEYSFVHFAYADIAQNLEKFNRYTMIEAHNMIDGKKDRLDSAFACCVKMFKSFLREYLKKGQWKNGWTGLYWSIMAIAY